MTDLEKVLKGLECCLSIELSDCTPERCPYFEYCGGQGAPDEMLRDALVRLKDRAPRVMSWDEARLHAMQYMDPDAIRPVFVEHRSPDRGQLIWAGGYAQRMMLTLQDEYGVKFRFWSDRPTEQQREAQMWDS